MSRESSPSSPRSEALPAPRLHGYTLVELMIVVVLIALLSGVAAVAAGSQGSQHLDMAERQVRDALGWAQSQARSSRAPIGVVFDPGADRFALVDETGAVLPDPFTQGDYLVSFRLPNQPRLVRIAAADFGACGQAVIFDAQGVPLTGGTITLSAGAQDRTLTVNAALGSVSAD